MLACTVGASGTSFCTGSTGLANSNATCQGILPNNQGVCTYAETTPVCKTGDCLGLLQCSGVWGSNQVTIGGFTPATLFEPTSNSSTNVNYDASNASGYNVPITVTPSVAANGANCYAPGCTSDLNATCPTSLQVTEAPGSTVTSTPCGTGYCQSGSCQNNTCVIGCNDPADQCTNLAPPALNCDTQFGGGSPTYFDMYAAANKSGEASSQGIGDAMASCNQGTPTCFASWDCPIGETCNFGEYASFPQGFGICLNSSGVPDQSLHCSKKSDVGKNCGGYWSASKGGINYKNANGYTCASIGGGQFACVPQFQPSISGLGSLSCIIGSSGNCSKKVTQVPLWTGSGCPNNPEWYQAALTAGGGTTPYYRTFSNACPHLYTFFYDDKAAGFDCNGNGTQVNMTITFGQPK